jgi:glycosyltransferase involved in cell wall biosynthesis
MRIVTMIPALDEEAAIGSVVRAISRALVHEVMVVDNGSRDGTAAVAQAAGAPIIQEPQRGYGAACLAGALAVHQADILVFLDGDGSDDPAEMARVLQPILAGQADLVLGSRTAG